MASDDTANQDGAEGSGQTNTSDFGKQWCEWAIANGGVPATREEMLAIGDDDPDEEAP